MESHALVTYDPTTFALDPVVLPDMSSRSISVKTHYTGVSVGTEFALIKNKLSWGPYPLITGYQGVGEVIATGEEVSEYAPGDKVYYRDNRQMSLADGRSASGVAGTHCSHAVIDVDSTHGLAKLPDGVDPKAASMFVLPAVGLYGVDQAQPRLGDVVLVNGCGLIGLGVIAALAPRGCTIVATDVDNTKLDAAKLMGADVVVNTAETDLSDVASKHTEDGFDVVFECTGIPALVGPCIYVSKKFGTFVWQGNYGGAAMPFEFLPAHAKQLKMVFPCDDGLGPCRAAVLKNMKLGSLPWHELITHCVSASDAPEFYAHVGDTNGEGVLAATLDWT